MNYLAATFIVIAVLGFVAFWGWLYFQRQAAQSRMLFETQKHLLEKLGSTVEVAHFLASPEGKELLDRLKPPPPPMPPRPPTPAEVMFMMIWTAMILIGVGAGFYVGSVWVNPKLLVPAAIIGFIGVGILVGLMITHGLAKHWGLVKVENGILVDPKADNCRKS